MRRVQTLKDVQIVVNDVLNNNGLLKTRAKNQYGLQIKNAGEGTDDSDLVTKSQIDVLARKDEVPSRASVDHFYTQVWSKDGTPSAGDVLPPFCITHEGRVGHPVVVWLAASTPGTGDMTIQMTLQNENANPPLVQTQIFKLDTTLPLDHRGLVLKAGKKGPSQTSSFNIPLPFFGLGSLIIPTIILVNGQSSVAIGMMIKRTKQEVLV